MNAILVILLLASHIAASAPFLKKVSKGKLPSGIDFLCVALMLYYDVEIVCELFGPPYDSPHFHGFFESDQVTLAKCALLLFFAPWLFRIGAWMTNRHPVAEELAPEESLHPRMRKWFFGLIFTVSGVMALGGLTCLALKIPLWMLRTQVAAKLNVFIVVLYLPLYFLAFYVLLKESRTWKGYVISLGLTVATILAGLPIAERTNILLPIVILLVFRGKMNLWRFGAIALAGLVMASFMLVVFKWQYADGDHSSAQLIAKTAYHDLGKPPYLASAIERSGDFGPKIMPYFGSGYVYSAFFFVPRPLAPFKGLPTAVHFTSDAVGTPPEETKWGFAVGGLEEAVLNVGYVLAFPLLILYGMALGALNKLSEKHKLLVVATRLGSVWIIAQHLPAGLLLFGAMMGICWAMQCRFIENSSPLRRVLTKWVYEPLVGSQRTSDAKA